MEFRVIAPKDNDHVVNGTLNTLWFKVINTTPDI